MLYSDVIYNKKRYLHITFLSIITCFTLLFLSYNLICNCVLCYKDTYAEGMEKLVLAEDTSHIDDIPSDELREQKKKRRYVKAHKHMVSSSSDEDTCFSADERNQVGQIPAKLVPDYPEIANFVSSNKKPRVVKMIHHNVPQQNTYNNPTDVVLCQSNISCTPNGSDE